MRVPVHPNDLLRHRGLKKLAKELQTQWCGPSPLAYTSALYLLSQALGYEKYEDLAASSKEPASGTIPPSEADVRQALMVAIKASMTPSDWFSSDQAAIMQKIESLHFRSLSAFKVPNTVFQPPSHGPDPSRELEMADLRDQMAKSARTLSTHDLRLTGDEIESLAKVAAATDNLRDRAMMSCMLAGLRQLECLGARPSHFIERADHTLYVPPGAKKLRVMLTRREWGHIKRHVETMSLQKDELLFPSPDRPGTAMSPRALKKFCERWANEAGIDVAKVNPTNIRMSVKWNAAMQIVGMNISTTSLSDLISSVSKRVGHSPMSLMTKYYLSGLGTKLSE